MRRALPPSPTTSLHDAIRYHVGLEGLDGVESEPGGKMIRGSLTLAICGGLGGDEAQCVPAALAVELVHRASLVFDDIQDNGHLRNHRPTLYSLYGANRTINIGLALSCYPRLALQPLGLGLMPRVDLVLEEATIELCRGQDMDMSLAMDMDARPPSTSRDGYLEMVRLKTGVLMGAAAQVGVIMAGGTPWPVPPGHPRIFGENLGVMFQMQDDLLGIWGDPQVSGKESSDLEEGKITLPVIMAMERGKDILGLDPHEARAILEDMAIPSFMKGIIMERYQELLVQLSGLRLQEPHHQAIVQLLQGMMVRES